jgi:hypothetical protein
MSMQRGLADEIVYLHLEIDPSRFGVSIPALVYLHSNRSILAVSLLLISNRGQLVIPRTISLRGM